MSDIKYRWALYLITGVILATLAIQGYWNYKNYISGRQQLMNDIQESLDVAVDKYYTILAQRSTFSLITTGSSDNTSFNFSNVSGSSNIQFMAFIDSLKETNNAQKSFYKFETGIAQKDSIKIVVDSLHFNSKSFETLTSKIMVSITQDSLSLKKMDSLIAKELSLKKIGINYHLEFKYNQSIANNETSDKKLIAKATSVYIPMGNVLTLEYDNIALTVLKRNLLGIFLSLILLGSVIASLLYLLKIIKRQKQLSEMKNDLISNITHEFKTPIATIGVAMESITNFNKKNNEDKNKRYAEITTQQVKKLSLMVEKLLETASLDSEKLSLNFVEANLYEIVNACVQNAAQSTTKQITLESHTDSLLYSLDTFHFENALNNILDNAVKYGGEEIKAAISKTDNAIEISISDSGNSLTEEHKNLIFDKFYRVPKGNTHDVKGFGIGLYYTKKIIEKHYGTITVHLHKSKTLFKIKLPYAKYY